MWEFQLNSSKKKSFKVLPEEKVVLASHTQTILDALISQGIEIDHSCGGFGTCGTCRVVVVAGLDQLGPRNEVEQEIATDRSFKDEERLCCQNKVVEGLIIKKPY